MPKKYPLEVRLFAVQKRAQGHPWDRVAEMVQQEFSIDPPPSRRQMAKWAGKIASDSLSHLAMRKIHQDLPQFEAEWLDRQQGPLLSVIAEGLRGKDIGVVMAKWLFSEVEKVLGSERFRIAMGEFMAEREQLKGGVSNER
jgi:hypothetical protein